MAQRSEIPLKHSLRMKESLGIQWFLENESDLDVACWTGLKSPKYAHRARDQRILISFVTCEIAGIFVKKPQPRAERNSALVDELSPADIKADPDEVDATRSVTTVPTAIHDATTTHVSTRSTAPTEIDLADTHHELLAKPRYLESVDSSADDDGDDDDDDDSIISDNNVYDIEQQHHFDYQAQAAFPSMAGNAGSDCLWAKANTPGLNNPKLLVDHLIEHHFGYELPRQFTCLVCNAELFNDDAGDNQTKEGFQEMVNHMMTHASGDPSRCQWGILEKKMHLRFREGSDISGTDSLSAAEVTKKSARPYTVLFQVGSPPPGSSLSYAHSSLAVFERDFSAQEGDDRPVSRHAVDSRIQPSSHSQTLQPNARNTGKRTRVSSRSWADGTESQRSDRHPKMPKNNPDTLCDVERTFACPFYKGEPKKYSTCSKVMCKGWPGVKIHLRKHHREEVPEVRCPRCGLGFLEEKLRTAHINETPACTFERGASSTASFEPFRTTRSRKTAEEKWHKLFKMIYPNRNTPTSAFACSYDAATRLLEVEASVKKLASGIPKKSVIEVHKQYPLLDQLGSRAILMTKLVRLVQDEFVAEELLDRQYVQQRSLLDYDVQGPSVFAASYENDTTTSTTDNLPALVNGNSDVVQGVGDHFWSHEAIVRFNGPYPEHFTVDNSLVNSHNQYTPTPPETLQLTSQNSQLMGPDFMQRIQPGHNVSQDPLNNNWSHYAAQLSILPEGSDSTLLPQYPAQDHFSSEDYWHFNDMASQAPGADEQHWST